MKKGKSKLSTFPELLRVESSYKKTNINHLINKARLEEKKEKRNIFIIICAAVTAVTISGLIATS